MAANPEIDERTSQLVSKGRWQVPGYKVCGTDTSPLCLYYSLTMSTGKIWRSVCSLERAVHLCIPTAHDSIENQLCILYKPLNPCGPRILLCSKSHSVFCIWLTFSYASFLPRPHLKGSLSGAWIQVRNLVRKANISKISLIQHESRSHGIYRKGQVRTLSIA